MRELSKKDKLKLSWSIVRKYEDLESFQRRVFSARRVVSYFDEAPIAQTRTQIRMGAMFHGSGYTLRYLLESLIELGGLKKFKHGRSYYYHSTKEQKTNFLLIQKREESQKTIDKQKAREYSAKSRAKKMTDEELVKWKERLLECLRAVNRRINEKNKESTK